MQVPAAAKHHGRVLRAEKGYHLVDHVIDIEPRLLDVGLVRERANALDHLTRPIAILDDPLAGRGALRPGRDFAVEPAQAGLGVGGDGGEGWLTSCAIEAVSSPKVVTRVACARSI